MINCSGFDYLALGTAGIERINGLETGQLILSLDKRNVLIYCCRIWVRMLNWVLILLLSYSLSSSSSSSSSYSIIEIESNWLILNTWYGYLYGYLFCTRFLELILLNLLRSGLELRRLILDPLWHKMLKLHSLRRKLVSIWALLSLWVEKLLSRLQIRAIDIL